MTKLPKFWDIVLVGGPILILTLLILPFFLPNIFEGVLQESYWAEQKEKVQYQMQLWNEQKIIKYQVDFLSQDDNKCIRQVVVENDNVSKIINDCPKASFSKISQMFDDINGMLDNHVCGPNSCECDGPYIIDAVYDEKYHFPKSGKTNYHPQESWRFKKTNILMLPNLLEGRKYCTLLGYSWGEAWEVVSFIPMK